MTPYKAYKYCPRCSGNLKHETNNLLKCQTCGYNFFINASPCVGIIIENENKRIMLGKRAIEPHKGTWDVLGGFMEPGETTYINAIREAKEELGVSVRPGLTVTSATISYPYMGVEIPCLILFMTAKIIDGVALPQDDVSEIQYFSEEELDHIQLTYPVLKDAFHEYFKLRKKLSLKTLLNE